MHLRLGLPPSAGNAGHPTAEVVQRMLILNGQPLTLNGQTLILG